MFLSSSTTDAVQQLIESGKRNIGAGRVLDRHRTVGKKPCNCKCHRNPVIAEGIHHPTMQALASGDEQSIRILFNFASQRS